MRVDGICVCFGDVYPFLRKTSWGTAIFDKKCKKSLKK